MSALAFRTANPGDLDRLVEIHTSAFPDPRGHAERLTNFTANPRGSLEDLWVAEEGGEIVAHAFLFPLRGWFAGATTPVAGIATVGVAPEARGRGVAAALLAHLHARADAQKASVTVLYAFRQGFYARHGYAPTTAMRRLHFHPAAIPATWQRTDGIAVRRAREGDRGAMVSAYGRAAARSHGWIVRPAALWDRWLANERRVWMVATHGRKVCGYVSWSLVQAEGHALTRLLVRELIADDDATRRALLGLVGAQRDQVIEVEMEVDARDPLDRALLDADRARFGTERVEHALGSVVGGPMVRLVDVARGLGQRAYASHGSIDLIIDGRPPLHASIAGGKATLSSPRSPRAPLAITRAALGAVLYGGLTVTDAAQLGWASGEAATLERGDTLFGAPPFFALDAY